ncbi:hypothetical protein [Mesorhizobium sp. M1163]|uniref:hypothetical protein n=1 Tax=Mesorhizobium sp. M1163 TaxID=2957065 RepID=UPI0033370278
MSQAGSESLKQRLAVLFVSAFFAVMFVLALNKWANDASPIRSVDPIAATVKSGQGEGQNIQYLLFLENGSTVLVYDDRPRLIGSRVGIERVTRDNGFVFYRFPN